MTGEHAANSQLSLRLAIDVKVLILRPRVAVSNHALIRSGPGVKGVECVGAEDRVEAHDGITNRIPGERSGIEFQWRESVASRMVIRYIDNRGSGVKETLDGGVDFTRHQLARFGIARSRDRHHLRVDVKDAGHAFAIGIDEDLCWPASLGQRKTGHA